MSEQRLEITPTRKEIRDRMNADFVSTLPNINPSIPANFEFAVIDSISGRIAELYAQADLIIDEMLPDTATGTFLARWGVYKKIQKNPATSAEGFVTATGVPGSEIPLATQLTSVDGSVYETQQIATIGTVALSVSSLIRNGQIVTATTVSDHNFASGMQVTIEDADQVEYNGLQTITVISNTEFTYVIAGLPVTPATGFILVSVDSASLDIKSVETGQQTNLAGGIELTFSAPIAGVDGTANVQFGEIAGGTDIETDDEFNARIQFAFQNPAALWNPAFIEREAKKTPGVTRVFITEATDETAGTIELFFTRDDDDDIIPSSEEEKQLKDNLLDVNITGGLPAMMPSDAFLVSGPVPVTINIIITGLDPLTSTMIEAIETSLDVFSRSQTSVEESVAKISIECVIATTEDRKTGDVVKSFTLVSPSGITPILAGQIGIIGTITIS